MFHCHNLEHEDIGLMAAFNSTSTTHPRIDTKFAPSAYGKDRYKGGYDKVHDSPALFDVGEGRGDTRGDTR